MPSESLTENRPKVSALITAYNAMTTIQESLDALLNQTFSNFEIVVVDDGSSDQTASIVQNLAARDPRIHFFSPGRLGRARALNYGLAKCRGEWIAINDSDDVSHEDRLLRQMKFLAENPESVLVGTWYRVWRQVENRSEDICHPLADADLRAALTWGQPFHHSSVIMKKTALDEIGGYNEKRHFLLDRDIFIRLAKRGFVANIPEILVTVKRHPQQFFYHGFSSRHREIQHHILRIKALKSFHYPLKSYVSPLSALGLALFPHWLRLSMPIKVKSLLKPILYPTIKLEGKAEGKHL